MRRRGPAAIHANLTPMIDVTFLLIVFFVLVSQIVEVENVELELPQLPDPASTMPGEEQRVIVNVVPALDGSALAYRSAGVSYPPDAEGAAALGSVLERRFAAAPNLRVSFRADRRTEHAWVQPALDAVAAAARRAGVQPRLNLVILREDA